MEVMAKVTEDTEKEYYFSKKLSSERTRKNFINGKEYSFAVLKGTKSGKEIVAKYRKNYSDLKLVFEGKISECEITTKHR